MICESCLLRRRCFERRGKCMDYKADEKHIEKLANIRRAIQEVNDDWIRIHGGCFRNVVRGDAGLVCAEFGPAGEKPEAREENA